MLMPPHDSAECAFRVMLSLRSSGQKYQKTEDYAIQAGYEEKPKANLSFPTSVARDWCWTSSTILVTTSPILCNPEHAFDDVHDRTSWTHLVGQQLLDEQWQFVQRHKGAFYKFV